MKKKIMAMCLVIAMAATAVIGGTLAYFTDVDNTRNAFSMGKVDIVLDEALVGEDGKEIDGDRVQHIDYTKTNMTPGYVFKKDPTIHVQKGSEDSYIFLDMTFNKYSSLFWVMAIDAHNDEKVRFELLDNDGALLDDFKNENGVFSTTKFIDYLRSNKEVLQAIADKWFSDITHTDWEVRNVLVGVDKNNANVDGKFITIRMAYQGDKDNTPNTVNAKEIAEDSIDIKFMDSFQMPASVTQKMISDATTVGGMINPFNTDSEEFLLEFTAYAIQAATLDLDGAYAAMFN